jgi:uncharacterized membrane protein
MFQRLLKNAAWMLLIVAAVLVMADIAAACPNCKDGVAANDPQHAGLVRGYFYSILLMMGMPFSLICCFSIYMYREVLKARARDAAKQSEHADVPRTERREEYAVY